MPENPSRIIRREIAALDSRLPVNIQSLPARVNELTAHPRLVAVLLGYFAAFALLLATVGLYAVVAFLVAQQTREIGLRIAIGASPSRVARYVLAFALRWTALGLVAGLICSVSLTRLIHGLMFEVSSQDPSSFIVASAILLLAALLAAGLPSMRAARADPAVSLRHE